MTKRWKRDYKQPAVRYTYYKEDGSPVFSGIVSIKEGASPEDFMQREEERIRKHGWTAFFEILIPL